MSTSPACATWPRTRRVPPCGGRALDPRPRRGAARPGDGGGDGAHTARRSLTVRPARRVTLVPVLRAGLAMLEPALRLLPEATRVGFLGMARDEATLEPRVLPRAPAGRPRRRRGGGARRHDRHRRLGRGRPRRRRRRPAPGGSRLAGLVAAPEGLRRVHEPTPRCRSRWRPSTSGSTTAGFIVPGLGDAGRPPLRGAARVTAHRGLAVVTGASSGIGRGLRGEPRGAGPPAAPGRAPRGAPARPRRTPRGAPRRGGGLRGRRPRHRRGPRARAATPSTPSAAWSNGGPQRRVRRGRHGGRGRPRAPGGDGGAQLRGGRRPGVPRAARDGGARIRDA